MKTIFTFIVVLLMFAELHSQWVLQNKLTYQTDLTSVYFTDQNNGYAVGDLSSLFTSTDGGNNWNPGSIIIGRNYYDQYQYAGKLSSVFITGNIPGPSQNKYFAGDKGTIIKIAGNNYWADKQVTNVTVNLNSLYFTSADIGYCCGNSGTILKTTNGGTTWTKLTTGTDYSLSSIFFTDSNTGYTVGGTNTNYVGIILKTTNAGNTWKVQYSGQANRFLYSVHFENSTTGWACGWNGTVLKTTNGGTNWVLQTSTVTSHLRSIIFRSLQEGIAVGTSGVIIITTNGGTNWLKMQSNTTEQLNSVSLDGTNTAVVIGNKGIVLRNNGSTWIQYPVQNYSSLNKVLFTSKDIGLINASGLIYKTTNGGKTWNWIKIEPSVPISDVFFINDQTFWAVNDYSLFKTTNSGTTWVEYQKRDTSNQPYVDPDFKYQSVYFIDQNNGWLLGNDVFYLTIYKTTNGGKNWQSITDLDALESRGLSLYFKNKDEGWIYGQLEYDFIGQDLYFKHTTDGGKTWNWANVTGLGNSRESLREIKFTDEKNGNAVGGCTISLSGWDNPPMLEFTGAIVFTTTDGGQSWLRKSYRVPCHDEYGDCRDITSSILNSIWFTSPSVGYSSGGGNMLKTTDGGKNWHLQQLPEPYRLNSMCFTDTDNGWAVGENGVILKHQKEVVTAPINWASKIKFFIKDYNNTNVLKDSLIFGQNAKATNGLDNSLSEAELPPVPPSGTFDARFILPDDPSISTDKDIRSSSENNVTWNINLQYQDFPLKISWSDGYPINLIPGEFFLVDGNGSWKLNVNMKDTLQVILDSLPDYNFINIIYNSPEHLISEGLIVRYNNWKWNLLSVPLRNSNMKVSLFFTPSEQPAFGFDGKYYIADNFENGKGYWVKVSSDLVYEYKIAYPGIPINIPVNIKKGWNLIGPFDKDLTLNRVTTKPAGILTTPFYGFDNGYYTASMLNYGRGYWVKASSDGVLNYNTTGLIKEIEPLAVNQNNCGKITITDNTGCSTTLYDVFEKNVDLQHYEMPPLPPAGIFDARYTSGLMAERLDADGKAIIFNSASYPVTLKADGIDLRLSYSVKGNREEVMLLNGNSYTINESSVRVVEVKRTAERIIPKQFALHQNYPNPFNPRTKIKYDLPEKSKVNLSVYNILGERIAELVNSEMEAGYHEVEFNANSLSSGVYIYRIDTDKNHSVKKMLLLK